MTSSACSSYTLVSWMVIGPLAMRSALTTVVLPTLAHSVRISRIVAFVAVSVTRPSLIDSLTSARAGAAEPSESAKASAHAILILITHPVYAGYLLFAPEIIDDLQEDIVERMSRFVSDHGARLGQIGDAPRHVLEPGFVGLLVGNELDRRS